MSIKMLTRSSTQQVEVDYSRLAESAERLTLGECGRMPRFEFSEVYVGPKFVVVTGGTMSGLGKGTAISSLGAVLKSCGLRVTAIKIDPYLNVDAGTMSPYEHGEVFVLNDGGEVDLDLGNYERFLDVTLSRNHNITTGKIFAQTISKERRGDYLGKTVQLVPQVTDAIQDWISSVAKKAVDNVPRLPVDGTSVSANWGTTDAPAVDTPYVAVRGVAANGDAATQTPTNNHTPSTSASPVGHSNHSRRNGSSSAPDICLIEVGGTVGDIESAVYLEALSQLARRVGRQNFCLCHVSYVPTHGGQEKTKPTQHSIKVLREAALDSDFIFGRCDQPLTAATKEKISQMTRVKLEHVISLHDVSNIYRVPLVMSAQRVGASVCKRLGLADESELMERMRQVEGMGSPVSLTNWKQLADRLDSENREVVKIGIVGKYTGLSDSYLSVIKALTHASLEANFELRIEWVESTDLEEVCVDGSDEGTKKCTCGGKETEFSILQKKHDDAWKALESVDGVLCPGGFGDRGIIGKSLSARFCRKNNKPYLGICLGMQTAVIDFARDALNLADANSEEFNPHCEHQIVISMPEHDGAVQMGGTMRLGKRATIIRDKNSLASKLYDFNPVIDERHRHRFEVNPDYVLALENAGFCFVGQDEKGVRMEIAELKNHIFFFCVQYHPEFTSRPTRPSPPFLGFILAAKHQLRQRFAKYSGCLRSGANLAEKTDRDSVAFQNKNTL